MAKILTMPKRDKPTSRNYSDEHDAELAAFRARDAHWLMLADAALSASEKTIAALELAREEQERIHKQIEDNVKKFKRYERRKKKGTGLT